MEIIGNTTEFNIAERTAVAIGKFDGFHMGHLRLLNVLWHQREKGLKLVVFTFVPSPATFFCGKTVRELSTLEEKRSFFQGAGVDYLIEYPFCQEVADMEPRTYIKEVLADRLHAACVVAGDDVSYGKRGAGDYRLLQEMSGKYGYDVILVKKAMHEGREISSTYVREEVERGNMEQVVDLLGAPYCVSGEIIHGRKLGRTIGIPTANLLPPDGKLLPPNGVYYSHVYIHRRQVGKPYDWVCRHSITNIGTKPTVDDRAVTGVETYIYHFDGDVYGDDMEVYLLKHKRNEMRFDSIDQLKAQLKADIEDGWRFHSIENPWKFPEIK